MKHQNGFTLVELLVTIGIMVLLSLLVGANMVGLLDKQKERNYEVFKTELEEAACTYIELSRNDSLHTSCKNSGECSVTIGDLVRQGLIEEGLNDPSTNAPVLGSQVVTIRYVNGQKTCIFEG